jgi:hypothetical protein
MVTGLHAEDNMREKTLTLPEIGWIASTRVMLGLGIGFLLADRLSKDQRKGAGWSLLGVGALTTIPVLVHVLSKPAEKPLALVS